MAQAHHKGSCDIKKECSIADPATRAQALFPNTGPPESWHAALVRSGESWHEFLAAIAVCGTVAVVATQQGVTIGQTAFWVGLAAGCWLVVSVWCHVAGKRWPWTQELPHLNLIIMAPTLFLIALVCLLLREWTAAAIAAAGGVPGMIWLIGAIREQRG